MNILVPHNWILDFVKTDASPEEIAEKLSLHALSVENTTTAPDGDRILEIEVTSNRQDALSVLGVSREVSAVFTQYPTEATFQDKKPGIKLKDQENKLNLNVRIKKPDLCPRFSAIVLDNVEIKESPPKIRKRLEKVGIRSLNNAIDITNYMMIERGQPMHVFDYDKITGKKMILRESKEGESLITLDGKKKNLPPGTIVIQDEEKIIDLCGIMGGANSCVDMGTKRVVLFVQIYKPQRIRKTTKKMSFRTDASARFEKGIDPQGVIPALKNAAEFLRKEANAQLASNLIDIENQKHEPQRVTLSEEMVETTLGTEIEPQKISAILRALGFEINWLTSPDDISGAPKLRAVVPSWRTADIKESVDLVEEVARIYGYHNLPSNLPPLPRKLHKEEKTFHWEREIKGWLEGWGYTEIKTTSFTNVNTIKKAGLDPTQALKIQNPLTEDSTHLRPSLIPGLMEICSKNQKQFEQQNLFQLSRTFVPTLEKDLLPNEARSLCILTTANEEQDSFYQVKGTVEAFLTKLGIENVSFEPLENSSFWAMDSGTQILIGEEEDIQVGTMGTIKKGIRTKFNIQTKMSGVNIDITKAIENAQKFKTFNPPSPHPPIIEDLTFEVGERALVGKIKKTLKKDINQDREVQINVVIKNIYQNKELKQKEKKRVTFTIKYSSKEGSLSDKEVKPLRKEIVKTVEEEFHAQLEGKI